MIGLIPGSLADKKMSKKEPSRWPIFTKEQLGVVAGNLALSFSLIFFSVFVHISGSNKPITVNYALSERSFPPAKVEYR